MPHLIAGHVLDSVAVAADRLPHPVAMRIRREWFDELTRDEFHQQLPVAMQVQRVAITGASQVDGRFHVDLITSDADAEFELLLTAEAYSETVAARGPALVCGHATAHVAVSKRITIDGLQFESGPAYIDIQVNPTTDRIASTRGGLIGRLVRRIAERRAPRMAPAMQAAVMERSRREIDEAVEEVATELLAELNRTSEFENFVVAQFPETSDWVYRLSAIEEYLQVSAGPRNGLTPDLPEKPGRSQDSPLEVWVHRSTFDWQEPMLNWWQDHHRQLGLAAHASDEHPARPGLHTSGEWTVISVGPHLVKAAL